MRKALKQPKHEKLDYKKIKHGLSLLEGGTWPQGWGEGVESLKTYFEFIMNTLDSLPTLAGNKEHRDSKTWQGVVSYVSTPGGLQRFERLQKIRQQLYSITTRAQRVYGDTYSLGGIDALVSLNIFLNSTNSFNFPCVSLRRHGWEYWNGEGRDYKVAHTLYLTKTIEDMLVFINKDTTTPIGLDSLAVTEAATTKTFIPREGSLSCPPLRA